jgi:predicted double-glycine peptidase
MLRSLLLVAALLVAWAPPAQARIVRSLLEDRQDRVVIQHWDNSCGAAALATILTYHLDYPISEREVATGMLGGTDPSRIRNRGGFSLLDMKRFAERLGFAGSGYAGLEWGDLAERAPLIVPIRVRGYNHFVVVRSVAQDRASIADPGFGNYDMAQAEFLHAWADGVGFSVGQGEQTDAEETVPAAGGSSADGEPRRPLP